MHSHIQMNLKQRNLEEIANRTLDHYNQRAEAFWEGTREHDVTQNIAAMLQHIAADPPLTLLDFGCGPGRDLKVFTGLGHITIGLEGSARFAAMARSHSGCAVWQQDFLKLDLPDHYFDGVFANATLFHVPSQELPRVLRELHACLKPGGVLFSSIPRGHNEEGWNDGRYGVFHDPEAWRRYGSAAGFVELTHYYRPAGLPRERQPWLASVWRR
ncbi:MAG: class I SAM-dependent methyltransferase [Methylocella sp.]